MMKKIKLSFANLTVEFTDRNLALRRIEEWAEKSTFPVQVIYGPEGCGKTAWLKQSIELLKELGFNVIYINPLNKEVITEFGITNLRDRFLTLVRDAIAQNALGRLAWLAFDIAKELIKETKSKVAVITDDAFQIIGIRNAAIYVKALLNLIEYPPEMYERIITITATSEGVSLREIGRHEWADLRPMWNMPKEGFRQLYEQIPGDKLDLLETWRLTGGNPRMLENLYKVNWNIDVVIEDIIRRKNITPQFIARWRNWLEEAIKDPDTLWSPNAPEELINELIEKNLILYFLPERKPWFWIDQPPLEKDPELGIGRYVAWQTPLHREAIRKALGK
ncbi:ATP-binding protein [Caldivirga sp.]|uniref:ATP-binding protein n=1 Tax=Caldivirga sp. TaxID=2080243 RepID=UPI00345C4FE9